MKARQTESGPRKKERRRKLHDPVHDMRGSVYIDKQLAQLKASIDRALGRYLPLATEEPRLIHRAMRYSVFSGGKRIRPAITLEACRACGGTMAQALPAACAVELVHTYSLIHDDLPSMDDDDSRRGKPTCHRKFGEALAILAGDALLTRSFGILAEYRKPSVTRSAIAALTAAAGTAGMVGGQVMDIAGKKKMTIERLDRINDLKTGRLFEAAAALGAITAGADRRRVKAMAAYGRAIGRAFQIVDDCLDGDGYARLMGAVRARAAGRAATCRAEKALAPFSAKGKTLAALACHLADRIH